MRRLHLTLAHLPSIRVETLQASRPLPTDCCRGWQAAGSSTEQGTRALDALRNGVQEVIAAFGRGFLAHPDHENERQDRNYAMVH